MKTFPSTLGGMAFSRDWKSPAHTENSGCSDTGFPPAPNQLREYFEAHTEGRGIWKWNHYFDMYHRHFQKFIGREVHLLEVGIYSGGSLDMWKAYFGDKCHIYGVDIEPACKAYEDDRTKVFIGDQADRSFWQEFRRQVPVIDIVIDDGGHLPEQQRITLEEMLPHVCPGGVYVCEDVHEISNDFAAYVYGLVDNLNAFDVLEYPSDTNRRARVQPTPFQSVIQSVHLYPFAAVVEKNTHPLTDLTAPKHGTEWQPFL